MSSVCPLPWEVRSEQKGADAVSGMNSGLNPASLFLVAVLLSAAPQGGR
jgi:hypothetical protein